MLREGQGVDQSDVEAVQWYRKAADQGFAQAQHNLGAMFGKGFGVVQNIAEAARWFKKAADQGNAEARHAMEICLRKLKAQR